MDLKSQTQSSSQEHQNIEDITMVIGYSRANHKGQNGKIPISHHLKKEVGTLKPATGNQRDFIACGLMTLTSTQAKSTEINMDHSMKEMYGQLNLIPSLTTNSSVGDFLAKVSVLLGSAEDSKILEAHYSLKSAGLHKLRELRIYSLRMSRDCYHMTKGIRSKPSSERWMNWGMTANGMCLTAKIGEYHKTGNESSLLEILEKSVESKYFLSDSQVKSLVEGMQKSQIVCKHQGTLPEIIRE